MTRDDPSLEDVRRVLNELKYKPGTKLTADWWQEYKSFKLTVEMQVSDVNDPWEVLTLTSYGLLPRENLTYAFDWEEQFVAWVFNEIHSAELHEMKEHFKRNGKCVYDPHPELSTKPVGIENID